MWCTWFSICMAHIHLWVWGVIHKKSHLWTKTLAKVNSNACVIVSLTLLMSFGQMTVIYFCGALGFSHLNATFPPHSVGGDPPRNPFLDQNTCKSQCICMCNGIKDFTNVHWVNHSDLILWCTWFFPFAWHISISECGGDLPKNPFWTKTLANVNVIACEMVS